jgi:probable rRNA maturation factor
MLEISFHIQHHPWKKILTKSRKDFELALHKAFDALILPKKQFAVAISFISDNEMQTLNAQYRGKDKPTNVLSFPMIEDFSDLKRWPEPLELGDIVLAYETTSQEAFDEGKSLSDHTSHLLIHGLLHLFGYDHMTKKDAKEMEGLEVAILAELGIENPY